jgi:hypothetical protein
VTVFDPRVYLSAAARLDGSPMGQMLMRMAAHEETRERAVISLRMLTGLSEGECTEEVRHLHAEVLEAVQRHPALTLEEAWPPVLDALIEAAKRGENRATAARERLAMVVATGDLRAAGITHYEVQMEHRAWLVPVTWELIDDVKRDLDR